MPVLATLPKFETPRPFNVLSFDGGGLRCVAQAVTLGRIHGAFPKLLRNTDLLVGTSFGGIQALYLAAGHEPLFIREAYEKAAKKIFEDSLLSNFGELWSTGSSYYSEANLRKLLELQFGDSRLGDLEKRVAIVTFSLDNSSRNAERRRWSVRIFHNCTERGADMDARVVDVALRASAMPVYFPTFGGFVDGGVVANNTALVALSQAMETRGVSRGLAELSLLSLGSGRPDHYIKGNNHDWGLSRWAPHLLYAMLEGGSEVIDTACRYVLRDKYFRIDPVFPPGCGFDSWAKVPKIIDTVQSEDLSSVLSWLDKNWK